MSAPAITLLPPSIYDTLTASATAIQSNAAIVSWLLANFPGDVMTVYVGLDGAKPPADFNAPFVILRPAEMPYDCAPNTKNQERQIPFDMTHGIEVKGEDLTVAANRVVLKGLKLSDDFGRLLLACLIDRFGLDAVRVAQLDLDPVAFVPLYQGGVAITLVYELGLGGEPTL